MKTFRTGKITNFFGSLYAIQEKKWYGWVTYLKFKKYKDMVDVADQLRQKGHIII